MKKNIFLLTVMLINLLLSLHSNSAQIDFQTFFLQGPHPQINYMIPQAKDIRAEVVVNGAVGFRHIVLDKYPMGVYLNTDQQYYRPDNYSFTSNFVAQYVYIYDAPALVKVRMALFQNGFKVRQNFAIAAQFDKGYFFTQIFISEACSIKISVGTDINFSIFSEAKDAFNSSLPEFGSANFKFVAKKGVNYIRFKHKITERSLFAYSVDPFKITILTDSLCTNSCPYPMGLYPSTKDFCLCLEQIFYPKLRSCINCDPGSTLEICQRINLFSQSFSFFNICFVNNLNFIFPIVQICGDGVREGLEQCDNQKQPGCMNCTVEPGYKCSEDQYNSSSCYLCGN